MAAKDYKRFEPSIDIVNHAQRHLAFLEEVDAIAESLAKPHVIANAVCRYETCWLKLLSKNKGVDLLPPIDVHWAWHVHMLCPRKYAADVTKIAGELVSHEFHLLRHDRRAHESKTKQIWNAMFPDEPFEVDFSTISPSFSYQSTQVTYDIQAASSRQLEFYYNVALPHFSLIPFLQQAEARYAKFMYLKTLNRDAFLVPMYDIDIMWHTHQLAPESYHKDSMAWLGYILNHDDTSTDRSPGSHLNESYANTRKLWRETFKEEYAIPGVGYRGPNPRGKLFKIPDEEIDKYKPQSGQVRLDSITYSNNEKTGKLKGWLKASGYSSGATKITLHENESEPFKWLGEPPEGILTFELKPYSSCNFEICLRSMKGLLAPLMNGKKVFKKCCDGSNKIMQMLDSDSDHTELTIFDRYKGTAVLSLSVVERKPMSETLLFYLEPSTFETMATIPENVESMWGPVCLPKLPAGVENICHVADHKLVAKKGLLVTVRVIHSLPLNMSVIQVYLKDKLAAISHLVGQDQLPTSTQLPTGDRKWMTLDVKKGERAMLVKNHAGDWAIVKGNWEKNSKTKLGYLNTHVKLQSREQYSNFKVLDSDLKGTRIKRINARESFQFMGTTAELAQEVLHINCENGEMAEHIATIFSSLVLYTLCEPRRGDAPGADREKNANKRTPAVDPARYKMMKAAGYMTDTPSNSYWWWMWYNNKDSHHYHYYQDHFWDWDEEFYIDSGPDTDRSDNNVCEGDVDNSADTGKGMFCPWDPDNEHDLDELVSDFVSDTDGVIAAACGSCATSSGDNGIGDTGTSSGYDFTSGQDSGFSSCATSSGGGGGGGGGCGSSCGSSCGGGGGGGSSCGGGGGSSCGGD